MGIREISLDTETTGLDPYAGHRVVEIGCVEMIDHVRTENHFHVYCNPERDMPMEAERIHGISAEFLSDKPLFRTIAKSLVEFLGDSPLVIHNASFDMKFLNAELERAGFPLLPSARAIDTVTLARRMFPGSPANLDALCKRFNIDNAHRVKHGALLDAELLADVYLELKGGRQSSLGLQAEGSSKKAGDPHAAPINALHGDAVPPRTFAPSEDELRAHKQLIDTIDGALWKQLERA